MTCKEYQHILYTAKIEDLDFAKKEFFKKHLAECKACKTIFEEVSKVNRILSRVKETAPCIRNEQALTDSILASIINTERAENTNTLLDHLSEIFNIQTVRFACCAVILFCGMTYSYIEYNDMIKIVGLEQRLGIQRDFNRASIALPGINVPGFLYDYYELSNGGKTYIELTNKLILMKKEDLQALLNGYKTLDKESRKRLDEIQNQFLKDEYLKFSSTAKNEEVEKLQNEIERLKEELEQSNHKEEQK